MNFSTFLADAIEILIRIQRIMVFNRPTFNGINRAEDVIVNTTASDAKTVKLRFIHIMMYKVEQRDNKLVIDRNM